RFGKQETNTMLSRLGVALSALGLVTGGLAFGTPAQADVRVGVMTCDMDGGFGYILGSSRGRHCTFVPAAGAAEHYAGTISKFGVDIGYVQNAVIVWSVVAPTVALPSGSLTGTYGGATASATIGVGVGANVLVGGSSDTISLQPVSIEGGTGLNVSGGFASMSLTFQPSKEGIMGAEVAAGVGYRCGHWVDRFRWTILSGPLGAAPANHSHKPSHLSSSCGTWSCRFVDNVAASSRSM